MMLELYLGAPSPGKAALQSACCPASSALASSLALCGCIPAPDCAHRRSASARTASVRSGGGEEEAEEGRMNGCTRISGMVMRLSGSLSSALCISCEGEARVSARLDRVASRESLRTHILQGGAARGREGDGVVRVGDGVQLWQQLGDGAEGGGPIHHLVQDAAQRPDVGGAANLARGREISEG